ncbi:hypothetical protein PoB_001746500 [Plakobranchus ocellatus]|uniref:Uncharacterized protein n=1 Tax=Plakobranchus ocellatus TaxID=259542 RepID=A0AAV3Z758_9GAST|nr:hypothetical protein PoB_001746500 [Plakobranchus ocellatus]
MREKYQISVQNKFEDLGDAEEEEQQWENFKSAIMEAATEVIPKVKRKAKKKKQRKTKGEDNGWTGHMAWNRKSVDTLAAVKDRDLWRDMIANAYKQGT